MLLSGLRLRLPWCTGLRPHHWIEIDGSRWCEGCGGVRLEPLTYVEAGDLLYALRATDDLPREHSAEGKLLAYLGAVEARAA